MRTPATTLDPRIFWTLAVFFAALAAPSFAAPTFVAEPKNAKADDAAAGESKAGESKAGESKAGEPEKYLLRYRFQPGQTLAWSVEHRGVVAATLAGETETVETVSKSVKLWEVKKVEKDGTAVFENRAEDFDLWQKNTGAEPIRYNSKTDKQPPRQFAPVVAQLGKPISRIRMNDRGEILEREPLLPGAPSEGKAQVTIPLPNEPIPVGHSWVRPHDVVLPIETGGVKKVLTQQRFTFKGVKTGVARIEIATQILTPIHSAALQAKLIDCATRGTVRFDIDAGRVLSQELGLDKQVIGFRGEESRLRHVKQFTERFLPERSKGV